MTGIVVHLDDQCIGCGYCLITCPFEVPAYNQRLGIVRKCDMCRGRLAAGEAPACVQACPSAAIRVAVVELAGLREAAGEGRFLVGAPAPAKTVPATTYRSLRGLDLAPPALAGSGGGVPKPGPREIPLVWLLVLSQVAVGVAVGGAVLGTLLPFGLARTAGGAGPAGHLASGQPVMASAALLALGLGVAAMVASLAHLGRPQYAWRAVLGFRHSWLSREVVALNGFVGLAAAWVAASVAVWLGGPGLPAVLDSASLVRALAWATAGAGIATVTCSAMVYVFTGRRWWRASLTGSRFASTAAVGGLAGIGAVIATLNGAGVLRAEFGPQVDRALALAMLGMTGLVLAGEALARFRLCRARTVGTSASRASAGDSAGQASSAAARRIAPETGEMAGSASLLRRPQLRGQRAWRVGLSAAGTLVVADAVALAGPGPGRSLAWLGLVLVVAGEMAGRTTFFVAVTPTRMPGGRQ